MKLISSKHTALAGNILTTILVAVVGTMNIQNNLYSYAGFSPLEIIVIGLVAMSVIPLLEWIAYFRIGKRGEKWWKAFLLVVGIMSLLRSFTSINNIVVFLARIVIGVLYIATFIIKDNAVANPDNNQKKNTE
ncbi:hypothetical protein [Lactococcus taiwanensis]|uniref:hypothetical protein n=1 Tax=Lactococcus taiwanensis TaxID=1151742 RepID=UPI001906EF24|nr:hypothetical protein [Lactococcus taiwanensis]